MDVDLLSSASTSGSSSPRALSVHPKSNTAQNKKYKMMICKNWEQGYCKFGDACLFAHGQREVQSVNLYYKTRECKAFHSTGFCKFGEKCQFLHSERKRLPVFEEIERKGRGPKKTVVC